MQYRKLENDNTNSAAHNSDATIKQPEIKHLSDDNKLTDNVIMKNHVESLNADIGMSEIIPTNWHDWIFFSFNLHC